MILTGPRLLDVKAAFDAIPQVGIDTLFAGKVLRDDNGFTHIQGLAAHDTHFILTHSDRSRKSGRLLVVGRQSGGQELVAEYCLPIVDQEEPYFFHAGGCQLFGQYLVVPAEAHSEASVVLFLDVSDPLNIREADDSSRVFRNNYPIAKKAGAVGITTFVYRDAPAYLLAVHDRGGVDFYWTAADDFPRGFQWLSSATIPQKEKEHQAFCLLTDSSNSVYAIGLNRKKIGQDKILLYAVDANAGQLRLVDERQLTTTGGKRYRTRPHFRWGGGVAVVQSKLVLWCTSHRFGKGCHINVFDPSLPASQEVVAPTTALRPRAKARAASPRPKRAKAAKGKSRRSRNR